MVIKKIKLKILMQVFLAISIFFLGLPKLSNNVLAAPSNNVSIDIQGTSMENSIGLLDALGILKGYEDGTFKPNATITRAELLVSVVRLMNWEDVAKLNKDEVFDDVKTEHWAFGYVGFGVKMKLVSVGDEKKFRPDEPATYEQAIKMIVSALGYAPIAQGIAPYPFGYMDEAINIGLTKNVQIPDDKKFTREILAKLLYNALNINIMTQTGFGEEAKYKVQSNTLLNEILNINIDKGLVEANEQTRINSSPSVLDSEIEVAGKLYKVGKTNADGYLGYKVKIYYKFDEPTNTNTIIWIEELSNSNNVITVNSRDISEVSGINTVNAKFTYSDANGDNSKVNSIKIAPNMNVIYNGRHLAMADISAYNQSKQLNYTYDNFLKPEVGEVKLFDMNEDDIYDLAIVTGYETYIVGSKTDDKIYDKNNNAPLDVFTKDTNYKIKIIKGNQLKKLKDIKSLNVLSVAKSVNTTGKIVITINVSLKESIRGKVSEIDTDGKLLINDMNYKVLSCYTNVIQVGDEGLFYIDNFGNIAGFERNTLSGKNIGWLVTAAEASGIEKTLQIKMLTQNGDLSILTCAESIRFMNKDSNEFMSNKIKSLDLLPYIWNSTTNKVNEQLVQYQLDKDSKISSIALAAPAANVDGNRFNVGFVRAPSIPGAGNVIAPSIGQCILKDTAIVFVVPDDGVEDKDTQYKVQKIDLKVYINKNGLGFLISGYNLSNTNNVGVVVRHITAESAGALDSSSSLPASMYEKASSVLTDEGDAVTASNVWVKGVLSKVVQKRIFQLYKGMNNLYATTATAYTNPLRKGDIVIYNKNINGEATSASVLFSIDEYISQMAQIDSQGYHPLMFRKVGKDSSFGTRVTVTFGKVAEYVVGNSIEILLKYKNNYSAAFIFDPGTPVMKYSVSKDTIETVTIEDALNKGTQLFVRQFSGAIGDAFIIED